MIKNLNRYGEIDFKKNEGVFSIPLIRLNAEDIVILEESYKKRIEELGYADTFVYANHMSLVRDRLQMSFDLSETVDFHHLQKISFKNKLNYFNSIIEISKNEGIVWDKNNFVIDLNERRVKALLFDFEGFENYKQTDSVDGIKRIILMSLTKLNDILGKPKRADFIEQEEIVIRFAEDLLRANNISDISNLITAYENEIEYEEAKLEAELLEKEKNNKFIQLLNKVKKPSEKMTAEEKMKLQLLSKSDNAKTQSGLFDKLTSVKGMVGTIVAVAFIALVYSVAIDGTQAQGNEKTQTVEQKEKIEQQEKIIQAYRYYINGSEEEINNAYGILEDIGYENLQKKDKAVLIDWLIEQKHYSKAVATDSEASYKVGDHLVTQENGVEELEKLKASFEDNKVIKFDIASLKNQYQVVLDNKDIRYNEKRAKKLIEAFAMNNQIDELQPFMDSIKENDRDSYENLLTFKERYYSIFEEKREATDNIEKLKSEVDNLDQQLAKKSDSTLKKERDEKKREIESLYKKLNGINRDIRK